MSQNPCQIGPAIFCGIYQYTIGPILSILLAGMHAWLVVPWNSSSYSKCSSLCGFRIGRLSFASKDANQQQTAHSSGRKV